MYAIETRQLTKSFGDFIAIKDINLQVKKGEIHAIVGENGAGKSTLMNVLFGLLQPTEGEVLYNGESKKFNSPKDAINNGLGMVHQHFKLAPSLTVYENVMLGEEITDGFIVDNKEEFKRVQSTIDYFNFNIDASKLVSELSVGVQQQIEIVKMLHRNVELLILDEPTAVLIPQETEELFERLLELQKNGTTIIIITHKLDEVKRISDRVTVIRKGHHIGTMETDSVTEHQLSRLMVGRDVVTVKSEYIVPTSNEIVLEVKDLKLLGSNKQEVLKSININVKKGEIVGIAGVDGNGQSELVSILTGMTEKDSGEIFLNGELLTDITPAVLRKKGFALVPEDRYKHGLNIEMPIWANMIAGRFDEDKVVQHGFLNRNRIEIKTKDLIDKFDIRLSGDINTNVSSLSGGNAQKIIMAREIDCNPEVVIMCQPTRGIDIGSIEFIHSEILKLKSKGKAILLISSELSEILNLSDRIYVFYKGAISGERLRQETNKEDLGELMLGLSLKKEKREELE